MYEAMRDLRPLIGSQTLDELRERLIGFTRSVGFEWMAAQLVKGPRGARRMVDCVHHLPPGYERLFFDPLISGKPSGSCPVVRHLQSSDLPLCWGKDLYTGPSGSYASQEVYEAQAAYGMCSGIAMAIHLPSDTSIFVGIDTRETAWLRDATRRASLVGQVVAMSSCIQDDMLRLITQHDAARQVHTQLVDTERALLNWTLDGRSASAVRDRTGHDIRTVLDHYQEATRKMRAGNKVHAAARAFSLGLI